MDVWEVPCSSCSGLDRDFLMDVAAEVRNELRESASAYVTDARNAAAAQSLRSQESRSKNAMGDGPRGGSPFLVGITECPAMSKSSLIDGSLAL